MINVEPLKNRGCKLKAGHRFLKNVDCIIFDDYRIESAVRWLKECLQKDDNNMPTCDCHVNKENESGLKQCSYCDLIDEAFEDVITKSDKGEKE